MNKVTGKRKKKKKKKACLYNLWKGENDEVESTNRHPKVLVGTIFCTYVQTQLTIMTIQYGNESLDDYDLWQHMEMDHTLRE